MKSYVYSSAQKTFLVILRMLIGWHFLYEGLLKVYNAQWSAKGFLLNSDWIFQEIFKSMAANAAVLNVVDFLNQWGLVFIGLGLILGIFTRLATIGGILLLAMYYLANPPMPGIESSAITEGNYMIVNKNLIEMCALLVLLVFPTGKIIGLDRLLAKSRGQSVPD